ncbi:MAG: hypothetical protein ACLS3C_10180 [Oscillospiraceae bacterium]
MTVSYGGKTASFSVQNRSSRPVRRLAFQLQHQLWRSPGRRHVQKGRDGHA